MNKYEEWFILAKSKLRLAYDAVNDEEVHHNDVMYCIQQAVEVTLKTLIVFYTNELPRKTHDISNLCSSVEEYIGIPQDILTGILPMTDYVSMRYPHEFEIGTTEECENAYEIGIKLFEWMKNIITVT